jgi:hypothetical protein
VVAESAVTRQRAGAISVIAQLPGKHTICHTMQQKNGEGLLPRRSLFPDEQLPPYFISSFSSLTGPRVERG